MDTFRVTHSGWLDASLSRVTIPGPEKYMDEDVNITDAVMVQAGVHVTNGVYETWLARRHIMIGLAFQPVVVFALSSSHPPL
jgi:hypothetical protein